MVSIYLKNMSVWNLRQLMADRKLTNEEVAANLRQLTGKETHWTTVSRWKSRDIMPAIDGSMLDALCTTLKCKRKELLGDD
jgi:DNA-binding Xre family transcriptional regulator